MASVVSLRPHAKEDFTSYLGMMIALGSWAIMFAGLFFAYAGVRLSAPTWPPPGVPKLPVAMPLLNTVVLAASSVTAHRALGAIRLGERDPMKALLGATIFLGALFLGLQSLVWSSVWRSGLHVDAGTYASVFWGLTTIHALHVVAGLGALLYLLVRANRYSAPAHGPVRRVLMFWHFVDVVWVVTFVSVFVL